MKLQQIRQHPYAFCIMMVGLVGAVFSFVQMLKPSDQFIYGVTFMVSMVVFGESYLKYMFNPDSPRVKRLENALRKEWAGKQRRR